MDYMEFLKQLVETENLDDRMVLVETHAETFKPGDAPPDNSEALAAAAAEIESLKSQVEEQKKKYRERFFSGGEPEPEPEPTPDPSETITTDDIVKQMKGE